MALPGTGFAVIQVSTAVPMADPLRALSAAATASINPGRRLADRTRERVE